MPYEVVEEISGFAPMWDGLTGESVIGKIDAPVKVEIAGKETDRYAIRLYVPAEITVYQPNADGVKKHFEKGTLVSLQSHAILNGKLSQVAPDQVVKITALGERAELKKKGMNAPKDYKVEIVRWKD